jgi:nicotinamide riboside transporter PnuC
VFSCCDLFILAEWGINYFGLFQPAKNSAKAKSRNITITIIATIIFDVLFILIYFKLKAYVLPLLDGWNFVSFQFLA